MHYSHALPPFRLALISKSRPEFYSLFSGDSLSRYWKIPPDHSAEFVACMEDVLDLYHAPYDPLHPVVCMDESSKQLVGDVTPPVAAAPGHGQLVDHEYVRHGVAEIFLEVEPLTGRSHVTLGEGRVHIWIDLNPASNHATLHLSDLRRRILRCR